MHEALHLKAHKPQELHCSLSNCILKSENLLKKPNTVPTGQMVLQ
jgi:hypothetical protein